MKHPGIGGNYDEEAYKYVEELAQELHSINDNLEQLFDVEI